MSLDGSIQVIAATAPHIDSVRLSETNIVISGGGGQPNATYVGVTATNVALPLINWIAFLTNTFDPAGNFIFSNAVNSTDPRRFYRLQVP